MKNIDDASARPYHVRHLDLFLFLLICSVTPLSTLTAQAQLVWQSFNSGFGNSKGAGSSIISLIGEPFVGETSGNGIFLRSGLGGLGSTTTSVRAIKEKLPVAFSLSQNFPNPFNPSTVIAFGIPEASHVFLQIFDIVGREVSTLVNEDLSAGNYRSTFVADHLSSGVYFYRIVATKKGDGGRLFIETKKFMVIK